MDRHEDVQAELRRLGYKFSQSCSFTVGSITTELQTWVNRDTPHYLILRSQSTLGVLQSIDILVPATVQTRVDQIERVINAVTSVIKVN